MGFRRKELYDFNPPPLSPRERILGNTDLEGISYDLFLFFLEWNTGWRNTTNTIPGRRNTIWCWWCSWCWCFTNLRREDVSALESAD